MGDDPKRRKDDHEARSKSQLIDQLHQQQSDLKSSFDQNQAQLLHDVQNHQIELEMQNIELREMQQQLEEARDRYADLYDFAPMGYLTLDVRGRILEINLTGAAMLGDERAHIIGNPFSAHLAFNDSQQFFLYLNRVFHTTGTHNIVTEVQIKRGGAAYDVRLESVLIPGTAHQGLTCRMVMTDISEQKLTTGALQQTRSAQEALFETTPAMVFFKDSDLRYTAVSQVFADFLGHPVADILGRTSFDLLPHAQAEEINKIDLAVMLSGQTVRNTEHRVHDAKGNRLFLNASLSPYFGPDGKPAGLVGVGVDITPIKEAEQRSQDLLRQNRLLTRQMFGLQEEERRHLARELHDELGQWLTAIQAEAEAICSSAGAKREPEIHANARAIGKSASEVHGVIRRILRRLRPILLDEFGLTVSLHELATQWRQQHPQIVCDLDLDGDLDGLPESLNITLYRIVQETLTNIANHAQASHVKVWLRRIPGEASAAEHLLLTVQDNGKGMNLQLPFIKGLGMLGMRERAIASGGEFMTHSTPGQGVRIEIRLPVAQEIERKA